MEEIKRVSYEQIKEANESIVKQDIKGSEYAPVNERVLAYRKVYPTGKIETEVVEQTEAYVKMKTVVTDENDRIIASGTATETNESYINKNNMVENCETSSVGRALGFAGFGVDKGIASGEDMEKVDSLYQIAKSTFIPKKQAIKLVQLTINDLCRKMAVRVADLNDKVDEKLWCDLKECSIRQLLKIENIMKTLNHEENEWHDIYGTNSRIKEYVGKGVEVLYESSRKKFGMLALEKAGTDEVKRDEIIQEYTEIGIDLN